MTDRTRVLDQVMEFDHVIRVHADGTITDAADVWAPELREDELSEWAHIIGQPTGWTLMHGYSGQYGYSGPIMHDSEYVGGRMAKDILTSPGLYVALLNQHECGDDCSDGCPGTAGWAVAYIPDDEHAAYPHEWGTLYDCPACEATCFCARVETGCVHCALKKEENRS